MEHNNKQKTCEFFVVAGNSQAFLGMLAIETGAFLTINCNTINMQTQHEQIYSKTEDEGNVQTKYRKQAGLKSVIKTELAF